MNEHRSPDSSDAFDRYADQYEAVLNKALFASGESWEYFVRRRVEWLKDSLKLLNVPTRRILDFGCGTGTTTPHLLEQMRAELVVGVDTSEKSLAVAKSHIASRHIEFANVADINRQDYFDIAYCNGVIHHIPRDQREQSLSLIRRWLRPNGLVAIFENNPWNPGAWYCMRVNPWDHDSIPISAPSLRHLLTNSGFKILTTHFLFVFPRWLALLRLLEKPLCQIPLGAQYVVLAQS